MNSVQGTITNVMRELGYTKSELGTCAGLSIMWVQAYLCDDMQKLKDRITLLCQSDFIEKAKKLSAKIARSKPENRIFTPEEINIREALIFLDGVQIYGNPAAVKVFLGKEYAQMDNISISAILNSIELEKQGGMTSLYTDIFKFNETEISEYFNTLRTIMHQGNKYGWGKCAFTLGVSDHQIGLSYDPDTDKWQISNLGGIITNDNSIFSSTFNLLVSHGYAEITPDMISTFIKLAFNPTNDLIFSIKLFTTEANTHKNKIEKVFSNMKKKHLITKEMTNQVDSKNISMAILAVQSDDLDTLKKLVNKGENINQVYKIQDLVLTLLGLAVRDGNERIVKFLLENGADVTILNESDYFPTLLQNSMSINLLELLSHHGVNLHKIDKDGYGLMHFAAMNHSPDIIRYLVSKKFNPSQYTYNAAHYTAAHFAALNNDMESLDTLIECGADINRPSDHNGERPIHIASAQGNISFIRKSVAHGININQIDDHQNTIVHYAVQSDVDHPFTNTDSIHPYANTRANIIHFLSEMNVDLNAKNSDGLTPLQLAVIGGNFEAVSALMQHHIDINQPYPNNVRPIFNAMTDKHWDIVMLYLLAPTTQLNPLDIKLLNQHRSELTEAFIQYVHSKTDVEERKELVQSVLYSDNLLGEILNTFMTTIGFSYSSYQHHGKQITHSIAKIIDEFPDEDTNDYSQQYTSIQNHH